MITLNRHNFYCNAFDPEDGKTFIIFSNGGKFFSVETNVWHGQENSVCVWDNYLEMMKGITWHEWILAGISDEQMLQDINAL